MEISESNLLAAIDYWLSSQHMLSPNEHVVEFDTTFDHKYIILVSKDEG